MSEVDMLGPLDIHQYLLARDVRHEIVRLPKAAPSAPTLAEALGLPAHRCVAVSPFYAPTATGSQLVVVLSPSDTELDVETTAQLLAELLRNRLGASLQFGLAGAALVSRLTDYLAGHLSPLLLPAEVIVVATQPLVDLATTVVYTATGDAGTALALRALDLLVLTQALVLPARRQAARGRPITIDLAQPSGALADKPARLTSKAAS